MKNKTRNMISKKELLELIENCEKKNMLAADTYWAIKERVNSLPDDQPDLIPFQWPVKEGYEVVTRDGRKVVKIDFWEMLDMPVLFAVEEYSEPFTALPDGRTCLSRQSECDLFLRRKEKKVWVVEGLGSHGQKYLAGIFYTEKEALSKASKVNIYTIYEATLKPVV